MCPGCVHYNHHYNLQMLFQHAYLSVKILFPLIGCTCSKSRCIRCRNTQTRACVRSKSCSKDSQEQKDMSSHTHVHHRHVVATRAPVTCVADAYQHCDVSLHISPSDCRCIHRGRCSSRPPSARSSFFPSVRPSGSWSDDGFCLKQDTGCVIRCTFRTSQSKTAPNGCCFSTGTGLRKDNVQCLRKISNESVPCQVRLNPP